MTSDRNVDRTIVAWLDLMPSEAPDRAVASVLQAVATEPQVRRPLRPATWRIPRMNKLTLLGAAALLTAVVIGSALMGGAERETDRQLLQPPPTAGPSVLERPVSPGIVRAWFGGPRPGILDAGNTANTYIRWVTGDSIALGTKDVSRNRERFRSDVVATPGELAVRAVGSSSGCREGEAGRYHTSISPGGTVLDIALVDDECAARAGALAGRWYSATCPTGNSACLGALEAYEYGSGQFTTALDGSRPAAFGELTYDGREGWTNTNDFENGYWLEDTAWYRALTGPSGGRDPGGRSETKGIYVFSGVAGAVQQAHCGGPADPAAGATAREMVEWIHARPSLEASSAEPVEIGGAAGVAIDVRLARSWTGTCPDTNGDVVAAVFTGAEGTGIANGFDWGVGSCLR